MTNRTMIPMAVCVVLVACASVPRMEQDTRDVRDTIERFRSAVNTGDTLAFFRLMADDLEVFPPGSAPLKGAAAHDLFRGLFNTSVVTLPPFTNEEIEVTGNIAVQRYAFQFIVRPKAGGPTSTQTGTGLHIWRRTSDGHWRLAKDIWTSIPGT